MPDAPLPLLDAPSAAFIAGPVSINVAASRGGMPALSRAVGCRVSADRRLVTVLVGAVMAAEVLEGVRRNGAFAAVFSDPPTHRTLQLKGRDAIVLPVEAGDAALADAYRAGFAAVLAPMGYPPAVICGFLAVPAADLVTVRFTPSSVFQQTPGPHAGEPLGGSA